MITDPDDPTTPHSCRPGNALLVGKMLAKRYMLEVGTQIRENRKRPRQAFDDAVCSVDERFEDHSSEIRDAINLDAILPELQTTKDGHRFLQFEDKTEARRMLVFFAEKDMDALCDAQYVLGDGNYKYNPMEFHNPGQLYTLHAVVKGEAQPVVYALMQSCDTPEFGNVGTLSTTATWIFDFELAAIQATKQVFGTAAGTPRFENDGPRTTNMVEGWHNGLHSRLTSHHPDLAEFIQFLQVIQHSSQNRIQALLLDHLAVASAPGVEVSNRNKRLQEEMALFSGYLSSAVPTFQDVLNYLDRITILGVLP
ncbi:hypothetical protein HPB47_022090 [Ixodes persulcatus]|uniref:Uncharacterized protein n=1 Tax=Ixodes persulcatus TaxID=34615 RepID=A0AC60QAP3_IXOPE|nr:hypothetical protein HPB47_022090 [Ixodes persulcatus]